MEAYAKKVRDAALRREGDILFNSSLDHAAVLSSALFEHAGKEVCIFTGQLNAHVYGSKDLMTNIQNFLSVLGRKVRVIIEDPSEIDKKDHNFLKSYFTHKDVEFKTLAGKDVNIPFHFMVMDEDSYRFEEDKDSVSAVAAFGDDIGGANLTNIFNQIWEMAPALSEDLIGNKIN